jgi:hypothetical protein
METTARVGLKMFLNCAATTKEWSEERDACALELESNPMAEFVELPEKYGDLEYCNMLCGVIEGGCEAVRMRVSCGFVQDPLRGDPGGRFVMRVKLLEIVPEEYPYDE